MTDFYHKFELQEYTEKKKSVKKGIIWATLGDQSSYRKIKLSNNTASNWH